MKLNFRNVDGGGTLAHGVTPILIPPPSGGVYSTRSTQTSGNGASPRQDASVNNPHHAGYLPMRSQSRRCHVSLGAGILYLLGILLILSLPFALPVAISHAVRIVDLSRNIQSATAAFKSGEESSDLSFALAKESAMRATDASSFTSDKPKHRGDPLLPPVKNVADDHSSYPPSAAQVPVSAAQNTPVSTSSTQVKSVPVSSAQSAPVPVSPAQIAPHQEGRGSIPSGERLNEGVRNAAVPSNNSFDSFGVINSVSDNKLKRSLSQTDRLEPIQDEWSKFVVVRHGNLYMSETFESRLNDQVAAQVLKRHPEIFGHVQKDCGGEPDISFSFKHSPKLEAVLEIVTQCGPQGSSCVIWPLVDDLRRLHVNVASAMAGEHFLTADATKEREAVSWGPLIGPLKVALLEKSVLAFKKTCPNSEGSGLRYLTVGIVKEILRDIEQQGKPMNERNNMVSTRFDVFRYDAHPHHHIRAKSNESNPENKSLREENRLQASQKRAVRNSRGMAGETETAESQNAGEGMGERKRDLVMSRDENSGAQ